MKSVEEELVDVVARLQHLCARLDIVPPVIEMASFKDGMKIETTAKMLVRGLFSPYAAPQDFVVAGNEIELLGVKIRWPKPALRLSLDSTCDPTTRISGPDQRRVHAT